jgi:hypothetical protein
MGVIDAFQQRYVVSSLLQEFRCPQILLLLVFLLLLNGEG